MARSAAVGLGIGGIASILVISGIQGESIAEVVKGEFGKEKGKPFPNPGAVPTQSGEQQTTGSPGSSEPSTYVKGNIGGPISPFPKGTRIAWGRSDKGVDGRVSPGTPMLAMGNGVVEVRENPGGFGTYPILKIDNDGSFYYGHSVPIVPNGTRVRMGEPIAHANLHGQGNATTPGWFEIGNITAFGTPDTAEVGKRIRNWLIGLPQV